MQIKNIGQDLKTGSLFNWCDKGSTHSSKAICHSVQKNIKIYAYSLNHNSTTNKVLQMHFKYQNVQQ